MESRQPKAVIVLAAAPSAAAKAGANLVTDLLFRMSVNFRSSKKSSSKMRKSWMAESKPMTRNSQPLSLS